MRERDRLLQFLRTTKPFRVAAESLETYSDISEADAAHLRDTWLAKVSPALLFTAQKEAGK